ncbi:hypothetical protein FRC02_005730 [Tulasnella sp. 418]|nr:hypothetical protein FRC02_005730 [Tulasnella sp. 418]
MKTTTLRNHGSSGPGGQNVNKVNTKAIIRLGPISQTMWIPRWAVDALRNSPAYVKYNDSILISSTKHRSQSDNVQDCLDKLHSLIRDSASAPIKTPLSEETIAKLAASERAFKARVRKEKEKRSQTKASRRNVGHWD